MTHKSTISDNPSRKNFNVNVGLKVEAGKNAKNAMSGSLSNLTDRIRVTS